MLLRLAVSSALLALLVAAMATVAGAADIHPDLQQILSQKNEDEFIKVLLIFDDPINHDDLESEMDRTTPEKRRRSVIAALKKHAKKVSREARDVLLSPVAHGHVRGDATLLYFANAVAFEGDRYIIEYLANLKSVDGELLYDLPMQLSDMTDTKRGEVDAQPENKDGRQSIAWNVAWVNADDVWNNLGYTGDGIIVGHIDTGIYLDQPDIANRLWVNPGEIPGNDIDDDGNGFVDDIHGYDFGDNDGNPNDDSSSPGHGTHTAGTVCGDGTRGTVTGVAPGATIMAAKTFSTDGTSLSSSAWAGQQYLIENGARILTMSLGASGVISSDSASWSFLRATRYNANNIREAGVLLFNSAGNEHNNYDPPDELGATARVPSPWFADPTVPYSSTSGVFAVGGTGYQNNSPLSVSSRGPVTWQWVEPWTDWPLPTGLIKPDIAAPGTSVNSLVIPSGYSGDNPFWSGTSMACPHVAGVAALMLEKNPTLSETQIAQILEQTALDLYTPGKDNIFGAGLVDALAAVVATPTSQTANLFVNGVMPDPDGDFALDPGEISEMAFELRNANPLVNATNVQGFLTVVPNDYVTVGNGVASFPDIPMSHGTGDNLGDPFTLDVDAAAPMGYPFTMLLQVTADGGFDRTFDIEAIVGLPDFLTHEIGHVFGTITDQGIIGYLTDDQIDGSGFGRQGGGSELFLGSLWAGNHNTYICNRDYHGTGAGTETYEWEVRVDPTGRVRNLGATAGADQVFQSVFTDDGHASPRNITVTQTSYAWSNSPDDDFVIMEYFIQRNGGDSMSGYYAGIFCDWDIGDAAANLGGLDAGRHAIWLYQNVDGPYYGLVLLGDATPGNISFIHNPTYVYPNAAIDDNFKARFLRNIIQVPETPAPDDWSMICSTGPYTMNAFSEITVAFAMVYGENLQDLLDNMDAAEAAYDTGTPVDDQVPTKVFRLAQNHPNPFNPQTTLKYSVAQDGHVELAVFDVSGRLIRTLVSEARVAGEYQVNWDGTDTEGQRVPSGVYFAKFRSGEQAQTRKMMLVK